MQQKESASFNHKIGYSGTRRIRGERQGKEEVTLQVGVGGKVEYNSRRVRIHQ